MPAADRLWPRGLRARLSIGIAVVVALALGAAFVGIYRGTGSQLRGQIDRDLRVEVGAFAAQGLPGGSPNPRQVASAASSYIAGRPFGPAARLLIARVPGGAVVTNQPELLGIRGQGRSDQDHEPGSIQATENAQVVRLRQAPPGYSEIGLHDAGTLRLLTQAVTRGGHALATVSVGEPLAPVTRAQRGVARTFALWGSLTLVAAALGGYLLAARTTRPLRRLASTAALIDAGDLSRRVAGVARSGEVRVVAEAFDHMLERLQEAFARQQEFVSDTSHELRTPLTVIAGQIEVLARQHDVSDEDVERVAGFIRVEIARMERLVDDLLLLASIDEQRAVSRETIEIAPFTEELWQSIRELGERRFELPTVPQGTLSADSDRLTQALRNIARNAVEHTQPGGLVRLSVSAFGDTLTFAVDDDGPGIPSEERARVFDRFHRSIGSPVPDGHGAGLGLAIAQAIIRAHGGRIWADAASSGGARVAFALDGFRPKA